MADTAFLLTHFLLPSTGANYLAIGSFTMLKLDHFVLPAGAYCLAIGSFTMFLPHVIAGVYELGAASTELCDLSGKLAFSCTKRKVSLISVADGSPTLTRRCIKVHVCWVGLL